MNLPKRLLTPESIMWAAIVMYSLKVVSKLTFGHYADMPAVYGDGWHNVSDILEAGLVLMVLRFVSSGASPQYPNGKGNYESLFVLIQGCLLGSVGSFVGYKSLYGIYTGEMGSVVASGANTSLFVSLVVVYAVSAGLSFTVSHYQVQVGREHNRPLVLADGEETKSDGYIELGVLAGIVGMFIFSNPLFGHLAGCLVAVKLIQTGISLSRDGMNALMQKTIGTEHDHMIKQFFMETPGVSAVDECKTWRVGGLVKVMMKVIVGDGMSSASERDLKKAVSGRIVEYLASEGMPEVELHVRFDPGSASDKRVAYAVVVSGEQVRITSIAEMTHLRVCDMQYGKVIRIKDVVATEATLGDVLAEKCVAELVGWLPPDEEVIGEQLSCAYRTAIVPFPPEDVHY